MLTDFNYQIAIKTSITQKLYSQQLLFWNKKLHNLACKNALTWGRTPGFGSRQFGIWFKNKEYHSIPNPGFDAMNPEDKKVFCIELHPDNPDLHKEMSIIAEEMDDINSEMVLVERFISNLVLFKAPPEVFKEILGENLYQCCYQYLPPYSWDKNAEFSINTFIKENQKILQLMRQRLLVNLVTMAEYK